MYFNIYSPDESVKDVTNKTNVDNSNARLLSTKISARTLEALPIIMKLIHGLNLKCFIFGDYFCGSQAPWIK